jgi:hypothetical protein
MDILEGIAFLLAASGIYHLNSKSRYFALVLTSLCIFVGAMGLLAVLQVTTFLWLAVWLLVLWWLLLPSVRTQFHVASKQQRAA